MIRDCVHIAATTIVSARVVLGFVWEVGIPPGRFSLEYMKHRQTYHVCFKLDIGPRRCCIDSNIVTDSTVSEGRHRGLNHEQNTVST